MIYKLTTWIFKIVGIEPTGSKYDTYCIVLPLTLTFYNLYTFSVLPSWIGFINLCIAAGFAEFLLFNIVSFNNHRSIMSELAKIEKELERIGADRRISLGKKMMRTMAFIPYCMVILGSLLLMKDVTALALLTINEVLYTMPLLQHMMMVETVETMFASLNVHLRSIARSADKALLAIVRARLDSVFKVHSALHVIVSDINCLYWFYLLMIIGGKVFAIVYWLTRVLSDITELKQMTLLSPLQQIMFLIPAAMFCNYCSKEANRSAYIAHGILQQHTHPQLWEEIGRFSRLNGGNKVEFTIGGIFALNLKWITKVTAAVFSYVTIAVQLRDVQMFGSYSTNVVTPTLGNASMN